MASPSLEAQLKDADIEFDETILRDLNSLINDLNLGTDDLVNEWLAYQHNNNASACIDHSSFKGFSKHLRYSQSAKLPKKTRSRSGSQQPSHHSSSTFIHNHKSLKPLMEVRSTPNTNHSKRKPHSAIKCNALKGDALMDQYLSMQTPSKPTKKPFARAVATTNTAMPPMSTPSAATIQPLNIHQSPVPVHPNTYTARKKRGDTIDVLNGHLAKHNNVKPVRIHIGRAPIATDAKPYRFMNEQMYLKQNAVKERITWIGQYLMAQIKSERDVDMDMDEKGENDVVYSAIDEPSQRRCYYLGRIVNDGESASDKITAGNMMLQDEYAKTIRLDLSSLKSVSLFPGQIVAVCGVNSSGKEIHAERIYQKGYIRNKAEAMDADMDIDMGHNDDGGVLQIMVGCGPFTAQNSLEFNGSPFHDFGKLVAQQQPNVVILMGPFTDSQNELIKTNEINCTFDELFQLQLRAFMQCIGNTTKVIITPSTKDIHHFSAFPQPKYRMESAPTLRNVHFIDNPCEFEVNNVSFGVCCADFLFDCCKIGHTKNIKDRLLSIMSHCMDQQNFYPLQPASKALRMDYNHYQQLYMHKKLHLLIMPSNLKQFAKLYSETNTICINPSHLTRFNSGGSYAVINIHKSNDYTVTDYSKLIRVDILRI